MNAEDRYMLTALGMLIALLAVFLIIILAAVGAS